MTIRVAVATLASLLVLLPVGSAAAQDAFVVVVHAANPVATMTPATVAGVFLKRLATWDDGSAIEPVDLPETHPTRVEFSRVILGRSMDAIGAYWRQQAFAGKELAPPVEATPSAVIGFVASNPRAIGYVPATTPLSPQVKVLTLADVARGEVYDASAGVERPTRLTTPPLRYPPVLRREHVEGHVTLEFVVEPDGRVGINEITVVETSDRRFNDAAISVVRGTRFRPGRLDGRAVAVRVRQRVAFTIAR